MFLLKAELALALRKLFVDDLSVEGNDMRRKFLQLLRKNDAALGEISARQLFHALGGPLDQIGEADAEFDDALVVVIVERLGDDAAFIDHRPKLIGAAGVIVADADGGFAGIATNDDEFHAFSEVVGKCAHGACVWAID